MVFCFINTIEASFMALYLNILFNPDFELKLTFLCCCVLFFLLRFLMSLRFISDGKALKNSSLVNLPVYVYNISLVQLCRCDVMHVKCSLVLCIVFSLCHLCVLAIFCYFVCV